jgi:hypothetical protein
VELDLSNDELRIIANAIDWTLNVTFDRSEPPAFAEEDLGRLETLLDAINPLVCNGAKDVVLSWREFRHSGAILTSRPEDILHICWCIKAFTNEIGHSRTEIETVTGVSYGVFEQFLRRLGDPEHKETFLAEGISSQNSGQGA